MTTIEYLDRSPTGWFALSVMRTEKRSWDWVALMIDVDPDAYRNRAFLTAREAWVRVQGKHRNWDAAWGAFEDMMTTRH